MKRIILSMSLTLFASSTLANVDPVVSAYQHIAALQLTDPSLAETLVLVNAKTAMECTQVAPFDSLLEFDEVRDLNSYIRTAGGMDGSETLIGLIDAATNAVCQSLKSQTQSQSLI